jgi:hypothetical protein
MSDTFIPNPGLTAPPGVAVLLVASEPGRALLDVVEPLVRAGAAAIVVVDDGSSQARKWVLNRIGMEPTVHLLRHARPQGRGAALKTGMQYIAEHLGHYTGLVTTTADARYGAMDVVRLMRALHGAPKLVILGAPETSRGLTSIRSVQNRLLGLAFRVMTRISLTDVQTGLRAIPTSLLPSLVKVRGERYEYELAMLLHIARSGHPMAEQAVFGTMEHEGVDRGLRSFADCFSMFRALMRSAPEELDAVELGLDPTGQASSHEHGSGARNTHQAR